MGGSITVSERILYHLHAFVKYEDKFEVPFDMTQDGVSQACGISRAHAAIEIKKMKALGLIEERLSHVKRGKMRRKIYLLTAEGKIRAADVVQFVKDNGIEPMVDVGKVSPAASSPARHARRSSPLPHVRCFFGRGKELTVLDEKLKSPDVKVVSLRGIPGIGKTTLAARLASGLTGQRIFWYQVKPWDVPRTAAESLAAFLSENGNKRLSNYLGTGKFELGEISFLLNEQFSENGVTLFIDDADCSEPLIEFFKMLRASTGSCKIVLTAEHRPGMYVSEDVVAKGEVFELELGGIDHEAAVALLGSRGITGTTAEELASVTHGHPLSLEMVTENTPTEARYQVSRFLEEKFYSGLTADERALIQFASVFQTSFHADAVPRELRQVRKGSMLREVAPGMLEIHSSLRDFVYGSMTAEERVRWHSVAADHFLGKDDLHERLYHLIRANRSLEAEMLVARRSDELLSKGNVMRVWSIISSFEAKKPKYADQVALAKARAASTVGELDRAWSILEAVVKTGGPMMAESLVEMGRIKSKRGETQDASRLFSEALEVATGRPGVRAMALRGLGVVENKVGRYQKAQELLEASAKEAMSAMDQKGMLLAHLELGNVLIGRGKYPEAIDHFSKCAAGFGPVELTNVYVNMGIACAHLDRTADARLHLENAVKLADDTGQPRAKAYAMTSLAEVLTRTGDPERAKEHCFGAIEVFSEIGDRLGMSAAYANLGMAERLTSDLRSSEEHYRESLASLDGMDVPWSIGVRKMEFAQMLAEKGDVKAARKLLVEARGLFSAIGAEDMLEKVSAASSALK